MPAGNFVAGAAIPAFENFMNASSTLIQNAQSRRFSEKMYQRQYDDALRLWNLQNQYNSPAAQMQRFKDAGLNPNLIYGQGNSGPASAVQVPDVQPVQFREPRMEGGGNAMALLLANADLRIKNAQADNLVVQNQVIKQDAILRAFQSERAGFDLGFEKSLVDVSADARRALLRKTQVDTDLAIRRDVRESSMNASNLSEAAERIRTMAIERQRTEAQIPGIRAETAKTIATIDLLKKEGVLKALDIDLRRSGINPNDPLLSRFIGRILSDVLGLDLTDLKKLHSGSTVFDLWKLSPIK